LSERCGKLFFNGLHQRVARRRAGAVTGGVTGGVTGSATGAPPLAYGENNSSVISHAGSFTITLPVHNPGLAGGLRPSYLGPPESPRKGA
jgi:hypothetical protein